MLLRSGMHNCVSRTIHPVGWLWSSFLARKVQGCGGQTSVSVEVTKESRKEVVIGLFHEQKFTRVDRTLANAGRRP